MLQATEALRRAKFKFAGRQKIVVSRNWFALPAVCATGALEGMGGVISISSIRMHAIVPFQQLYRGFGCSVFTASPL